MNTNPSSRNCPECGSPLTQDSPQSLCPACLMRQAFASRTVVGVHDAGALPPVPTAGEIAGKFPQFDILECLGRGGMGVVYKARQKSLNRIVAIKVLSPEKGHEARFAERFAREAELLAQLNHPHIVTIHDFGEGNGLFHLVMEYVDGVNLRDLLRDGKIEPEQALSIVPPICEALQYAHGKGIVHRDIKPENLLLDREGGIKIADFGIASLVGSSGEISGTPPYMAPEQEDRSKLTDHRADIYALGVVLYEMLTGERPGRHLIAPSRRVAVDVRIDEMVLRALENEPERRYQTAEEFRTIVETLKVPRSSPPPFPPAKPVGRSMLRHHWWALLAMLPVGAVLGAIAGSVRAYIEPKVFESAAVIELRPSSQSTVGREMALIASPGSLEKVAERLDLKRRWNRNDTEARLREMVTVRKLRGTDLVSVAVRSLNPSEAVEIASELTRMTDERIPTIVHENASPPVMPVQTDAAATILNAIRQGALVSGIPALLIMHALNRRRLRKHGIEIGNGWWLKLASLAFIACLYFKPYIVLPKIIQTSPRGREHQATGRLQFEFAHPDISGVHSIPVEIWPKADSGWKPEGGQALKLKDGRTMWVRCRVISNEEFDPVALVGRSFDKIHWETRELVPRRGVPQVIGFPDGISVQIKWFLFGTIPAR